MSQPVFKVGERVGLVSVAMPECNGEYTVRQVLSLGDTFTCRLSGRRVKVMPTGNYSYLLEEKCKEGTYGVEIVWAESALRKLHKPSKYSFEQLLSEIKQCSMNTIEA